MKKFLALLLAVVMMLGLVACGGDDTEETNGDEGTVYKVAMITDYGDITDQSFNQTTYEAVKAYCEANGVAYNYYKPNDNATAERVAMVELAIQEGYNIVVMPGYAFGETIVEVADMYPDVKFIALDVSAGDLPTGYELPANVYSAVYQEELSGYMAGYAAVMLGYKHLGFLGGMAVPAVQRFGYGYLQGINDAANELEIVDEIVVEYIYGNQFWGDADITAVMDTWYGEMGVEVVFACGGGIYTSAAEAAVKVGGKVIGVDTDQAGVIDGTYGEGMTVTSAMKGLAATVKDTLADVIENDNWAAYSGQITTLGLVSGTDPEANYVQIPMASTQWSDSFTQDDYKALVGAMFDGTIEVSNAIDAMPEVDYVLNTYADIK